MSFSYGASSATNGGSAMSDALGCAAAVLGSNTALAQRLRVAPEKLGRWLAGEERPPLEVFLRALDIISAGPYAAQRDVARRPTVAVIPSND